MFNSQSSKFKWVLLPMLLLPLCMMAKKERILSPDGLTYLDVKLEDGRLTYSAGYRQLVKAKKKGAAPDTLDVPMLLDSPLGLYTNVADLSKDLEYIRQETPEKISHKTEYRLRQGKQSEISAEENSLLLMFTNPEAKQPSSVRRATRWWDGCKQSQVTKRDTSGTNPSRNAVSTDTAGPSPASSMRATRVGS